MKPYLDETHKSQSVTQTHFELLIVDHQRTSHISWLMQIKQRTWPVRSIFCRLQGIRQTWQLPGSPSSHH